MNCFLIYKLHNRKYKKKFRSNYTMVLIYNYPFNSICGDVNEWLRILQRF